MRNLMEYINVRSLISVDELAERLGDEHLRIFDTAVMFKKVDQGLVANSSIETYREAHIPGAAFAQMFSTIGAIQKLPIETFFRSTLCRENWVRLASTRRARWLFTRQPC